MKRQKPSRRRHGHEALSVVLTLVTVLPVTVLAFWGAWKIYWWLFPDPDVPVAFFPQGFALIALVLGAFIIGSTLGGFLWAAIAKQFLTKDELYQQANFGVKIPGLHDLNKKFLRMLYRNE